MKLPHLFTAALFCALLSSCATPADPVTPPATPEKLPAPPAGQPTASNSMAPRSLAGTKMSYTDLHSRNVFTFFANGTFQFDYIHHSGTDTGGRSGRYRYKITSPNNAVIDCGDDEVISLRFDSPLTATGTIEGDLRPYRFTLTRAAGE
jgi:hypothetical protein